MRSASAPVQPGATVEQRATRYTRAGEAQHADVAADQQHRGHDDLDHRRRPWTMRSGISSGANGGRTDTMRATVESGAAAEREDGRCRQR